MEFRIDGGRQCGSRNGHFYDSVAWNLDELTATQGCKNDRCQKSNGDADLVTFQEPFTSSDLFIAFSFISSSSALATPRRFMSTSNSTCVDDESLGLVVSVGFQKRQERWLQ